MLKQAYIEETPLFSWHCLSLSIEWHTEEGGSAKNDKLWRGAGGGVGVKKFHFASDVLFEWLHTFSKSNKKMNLSWMDKPEISTSVFGEKLVFRTVTNFVKLRH